MNERTIIGLVTAGEWEIDQDGQIWRLRRRSGHMHGGTVTTECPRHRVMGMPETNGALRIRVTKDKRRLECAVHRLVWHHYHGDIPPGHWVRHKNGDRTDNRPSNLYLARKGRR